MSGGCILEEEEVSAIEERLARVNTSQPHKTDLSWVLWLGTVLVMLMAVGSFLFFEVPSSNPEQVHIDGDGFYWRKGLPHKEGFYFARRHNPEWTTVVCVYRIESGWVVDGPEIAGQMQIRDIQEYEFAGPMEVPK